MKLPITDFIKTYNAKSTARMHMPGHKGAPLTGAEALDITEIRGADALFEAEGIIGESEALMSGLFGSARTLYSTEGSSLSIKTMLACARELLGQKLKLAAARSCHRAFINGCILLGIQPVWILPEGNTSLCKAVITADDVEHTLAADPDINAVYLTSPDYPGNMCDIAAIAKVCHSRGALLLVDNAHGAYLKFAGEALHPIDLGADMCADSAHKTLPALTGASMLHISKTAPKRLCEIAKDCMLLFASTSPSYVIMSSLEFCAGELCEGLPDRIRKLCARLTDLKRTLTEYGYSVLGDEPMKLTLDPRPIGCNGLRLGEILRSANIEPEYCDPDCVVLMPTPYTPDDHLRRTADTLFSVPKHPALIQEDIPAFTLPKSVMSMREAYFSPCEPISIDRAEGRTCAKAALSCQPSVPVILGGEVITADTIKILKKYSILEVNVL